MNRQVVRQIRVRHRLGLIQIADDRIDRPRIDQPGDRLADRPTLSPRITQKDQLFRIAIDATNEFDGIDIVRLDCRLRQFGEPVPRPTAVRYC